MSKEVHISSLVISANPKQLIQIKVELEKFDILEIAHVDESGKIIVTLETENQTEITQMLTDLQLIDGVVSVAMVFHQIVDPDELKDIEASK